MNMHSSSPSRFRPIQYLGNKTRLLDEIADAVAEVSQPGAPVADLFSGTAVVGGRLAHRNPVVAVDVQAYAATLARATLLADARDLDSFDERAFAARTDEAVDELERAFSPLIAREDDALAALAAGDPSPISELIEGGSPLSRALDGDDRCLPAAVRALVKEADGRTPDATAAVAFGGVYFSMRQAIRLDGLAHAASTEPGRRADLLMAAMLGAASEVANTVGKQFAQPIRLVDRQGGTKPLLVERTLRDRRLDPQVKFGHALAGWRATLPRHAAPNTVVHSDVDAFLQTEGRWTAAYADPPYTIDHYSRFYHVLETLARRDRPGLSRMRKRGVSTTMRGLYRDDRFQSDFCVPSRAPAAFERLFARVAARGAPLVLSYSGHDDVEGQRPRALSVDNLAALARRSFAKVDVREPRFEGHRKLNASARNASTERGTERLIVCRS